MIVARSKVRLSCTKADAYDVEAKTGETLLVTVGWKRRDSSRMKLVMRGRRKGKNNRTGDVVASGI